MAHRFSRRSLLATGLAMAGTTTVAAAMHPDHDHGVVPAARPLAPGFSVVWHNTDPKLYVEGCGLVCREPGSFLAVVPVVPRGAHARQLRQLHSRIHLVQSNDAGKSWEALPSSLPYYSAVPWLYNGVLYLLAFEAGTDIRNNNLVLLRSTDGGETWSQPVTLFKGHFWNCQTGMVQRDGRLYWAIDDISRGTTNEDRQVRVVCGDLSDVMNPAAWRISAGVPFPGVPQLLNDPKFGKRKSWILEPNLVEVQGRLRVLATAKINSQTLSNLCAVYDVADEGGQLEAKFSQYHPMPGGQLKFCVVRDEPSRLYWATANLVVDSQEQFDWWDSARKAGTYRAGSSGGNDRRLLMLMYSLDGLNWFQAGCIAQAPRLRQSFMYAAPVIDGPDLVLISRTSISAPDQHDADFATFHRIRDFRRLALNLWPAVEA